MDGASPLVTEKNDGTVALVKSDSEKKITPAGEYLTTALNEFDPEQYDSLAAISDGANKLLMLVCFCGDYCNQNVSFFNMIPDLMF